MFVYLSFYTLYYCIYIPKIVKKLRIHQSYSLNPHLYTILIHSPLKMTPKHQVYTLAKRFFHSFFLSKRWFAYQEKDQSRLLWCRKPLYFLTFSALLPCHQGYTLNMRCVRKEIWWTGLSSLCFFPKRSPINGRYTVSLRITKGIPSSVILSFE